MRLIVAALLLLCSAHAVAQAEHLIRPELLGFEPNPLDRHASRWLRWLD